MSSNLFWLKTDIVQGDTFKCGFCGALSAPNQMYLAHLSTAKIYICSGCTQPNYFDAMGFQTPNPMLGSDVSGISKQDVEMLYKEARKCTTIGAYTAAVMICRKILMNVAVGHGARENLGFKTYVEYLSSKGFIPPGGHEWLQAIATRGGEANHEIAVMQLGDAELILHFTEALLRFSYELPARLRDDNKRSGKSK